MYLHHPERNDRICKTHIDFGYPVAIAYPKANIHFELPLSHWERWSRRLLLILLIAAGGYLFWPDDGFLSFAFTLMLVILALVPVIFGIAFGYQLLFKPKENRYRGELLELILGFLAKAFLWLVALALMYGIGMFLQSFSGGGAEF